MSTPAVCLCGRRATGTTPGGEPECDNLDCHAAAEVERLRHAIKDADKMADDPTTARAILRAAIGGAS